jgi:hypothetical protein
MAGQLRSTHEAVHAVRRRRGDDGASLVEFALIAPVLSLLLFGVIEFGLVLNDYQSLRQSAREGARQAVVGDYGADCSVPGVTDEAARRVICTIRDRSRIADVRVRVDVDHHPGDVLICAAAPMRSITGMFSPFLDSRTMGTAVRMRIERDGDPVLGTGAETDPSGRGWAGWCRA